MKVWLRSTLAVVSVTTVGGCSSLHEPTRTPESVTLDTANSRRVHFVVHGAPGLRRYPELYELPVPMHEKIREGMRRYAAEELRARGWCPNGFRGPDLVLAYRTEPSTSRFWVDCL